MLHTKASATRIWQNNLREYEAPVSFLWEDVLRLEGPEGLATEDGDIIKWQNRAPKTILYFADGHSLCVLGKFQKWDERWNNYLEYVRPNTMLFSN